MRRLIARRALVLIAVLTTAACETSDPFEVPTGPTPVPVTETFAGTLTPNGAHIHPFQTQTGGTITATLTVASPETVVGLALGTWNGSACQVTIDQPAALQGAILLGTASAIGNYCARVYDAAGTLPAPTMYELQVLRP